MRTICRVVLWATTAVLAAQAQEGGEVVSRRLAADVALNTDPHSPLWAGGVPVYAERDRFGAPLPARRTEIRTRWTPGNLYLLFICPYAQLYLKPQPEVTRDTKGLWDWDVAEVFIGSDFQHIGHYTEYEVSPQGEWVDLDIDRDHKAQELGIEWNSRFATQARIDRAAHVWYAAMRIPMTAIGGPAPAVGGKLRINFFRIEGPPPGRTYITWQPPQAESFHTPQAFGTLRLAGAAK